jgi:hypothetical protein
MISAKEIIKGFKEKKWQSNPFEKMLELKKTNPKELFTLLLLALDEIPEGGTFIDAALSYLDDKEFNELIISSITTLRNNSKSEIANSIVAYATLQMPHLLKPFLIEFLSIKPNDGTYYESWVWREGGQKEIDILKNIILNDKSENLKQQAWDSLVNIRSPKAMIEAARLYEVAGINLRRPDLSFDVYSNMAGFEVRENRVRQLFFKDCYHLIFERSFFENQDKPLWLSVENHPTWHFEDSKSVTANFGGDIDSECGCCGNQLHRLIEFDKISDDFDLGINKLILATCMSCLGWEESPLFYRHNEMGMPESLIRKKNKTEPEFLAEPLKVTTVKLVQTPNRWMFQDWALSNSRENLNRLGGHPSWIQDSEYPDCPDCKDKMTFLAQLDSDLPTITDEEWLWGSGGICYAFWCSKCKISSFLWQCT